MSLKNSGKRGDVVAENGGYQVKKRWENGGNQKWAQKMVGIKIQKGAPKCIYPLLRSRPSINIKDHYIPVELNQSLQSASSFKFDTHQGPLDRCINNATSFAARGWKHNQVTTALLQMIAIDNMPLSTPERPGFKMFVKKIQP
ncbi:Protein of unknown function [Cotesia congregata]|uniref:Uncharacterized protein n=1 Tax=Cotesia congregata TaxID=51543 RepID=A0A8J2HE85_COTCN|nr:Protein of unknown function [Cotesia congregata]